MKCNNKIRDDTKNGMYHYFNDMIKANDFISKTIKNNRKSFKDILIYYTRYKAPVGVNCLCIDSNKILINKVVIIIKSLFYDKNLTRNYF